MADSGSASSASEGARTTNNPHPPDECFMVPAVDDCWTESGEQRVGAMAWWEHQRSERDTEPRPMPHLAVMTPAGFICLDCPATADPPGRYWLRVGEPPHVTVTPSLNINFEAWHGWLQEGKLIR